MILFSEKKQNTMKSPHRSQRNIFVGKEEVKIKITKQNPPKESFFGMIASEIRTQIHKLITGCRYCKCLARH